MSDQSDSGYEADRLRDWPAYLADMSEPDTDEPYQTQKEIDLIREIENEATDVY